jgi:hypothetical protein
VRAGCPEPTQERARNGLGRPGKEHPFAEDRRHRDQNPEARAALAELDRHSRRGRFGWKLRGRFLADFSPRQLAFGIIAAGLDRRQQSDSIRAEHQGEKCVEPQP